MINEYISNQGKMNTDNDKEKILDTLSDVMQCFYYEIHYPSIFIHPKGKIDHSCHPPDFIEDAFRKALILLKKYNKEPKYTHGSIMDNIQE